MKCGEREDERDAGKGVNWGAEKDGKLEMDCRENGK